jgi:hypothetical protein
VIGLRVPAALIAAALLLSQPRASQELQVSVAAPPALSATAERVRRIDPAPLARAVEAAGLDLPSAVKIQLIAPDAPESRTTPAWVVARAWGTDSIVIFPHRIAVYPYDSLESVVLHELVHLSLNARAREHPLPRWFHEGVAVSVESGWGIEGRLRLLVAAAGDPPIRTVDALFASESEPDTTTAYLLAAALVDDIRRRHGAAVPGAIAARAGAGEPFAIAFRETTGESIEEAASQAWAGYRSVGRWIPVLTSPSAAWLGILALAIVAFVARVRQRSKQHRAWSDEEDAGDDTPLQSDPEDGERAAGGGS